MDSQPTVDVTPEAGRHARDIAHRPRQNAYGDVAYEAADAITAQAERSIEIPVAPVGGPE
jgi:hypothetical protein